ncbi:uncharacterized protein C17orf80 homolog isoform X1 [Ornithorhynchus anatinus]|uniref:ATP synthase membrane subunit f n=2 Tax=Ornithorhynchus anatinus TaxID=9258 RepID=A0A6I8MZF2_ORNAN|nr:uncharacterized protein C17orf80 homolog isoform X1 [Ornithorhynchus anatinus]
MGFLSLQKAKQESLAAVLWTRGLLPGWYSQRHLNAWPGAPTEKAASASRRVSSSLLTQSSRAVGPRASSTHGKMAAIHPGTELCPHCKKPFKRLKSHLPYCKMAHLIIKPGETPPPRRKARLPKAALPQPSKKEKGPSEDLVRAPERNAMKGTTRKTVVAKSEESVTSSRSPEVSGLRSARDVQMSKEMKNQVKLILRKTQNNELTKMELAQEAVASLYTAELEKGLSGSQESRNQNPTADDSFQARPVERTSSRDGRRAPEVLGDSILPSAGLKLARLEPLKKKPLAEVFHLHKGKTVRETVQASPQNDRRDPKASEEAPTIPSHLKTPQLFGPPEARLQMGGTENWDLEDRVGAGSVRGHVEAAGNFGWSSRTTEEGVAGVENPGRDGPRGDPEESLTVSEPAPEKRNRVVGPQVDPFPHKETSNPSLSQKLAKCLREEKGKTHGIGSQVKKFVKRGEETALAAQALAGTWASPTQSQRVSSEVDWFPTRGSPSTESAHNKAPRHSVGLEWFPELHPGYLQLGLGSGRPVAWNIGVQKPPLGIPWGEPLASVPPLEPSQYPAWPAPHLFSRMGLLGALQQAWARYSSSSINLKKGGFGGITVLFAGYCVLCCSWSYKHLPHWHKHH